MIKKIIATTTLFALLFASSNAQAITVNLNPAKDNTLYEDSNGTLSNGAGDYFFVGNTNNDELRRALLQFDIAGALPSSANITSVSLAMHVSRAAGNPLSDPVELKRLTVDWGEAGSNASGQEGTGTTAQAGDATWTHSFSPNTNWTNLGGDFVSDVSATEIVNAPGTYTWSSEQLADDVQDMLDLGSANFGWIILGRENFSQTAKRFDSRESSNPPVLTIQYSTSSGLDDSDFDGDGDVDADDLADWQAAYGPNSGGDADSDGDTDGADYLVWQREFTGPSALHTASIPEPTSVTLMLAFLALAVLNRQGRVLRS